MRKWLEGSAGRTGAVLLVSFPEDPVYSSKPSREVTALEPVLGLSLQSVMSPPTLPRPPVWVGGHVLVGEIKVFLEIWRYDAIKEAPYLLGVEY